MRVEWRKTTRWPHWPLVPVLVGLLWVAVTGLGAWLATHGYGEPAPALCPLKRTIGVPCPTCGSTRGVLALLGGDPAGAWAFNPLVLTVLALGAVLFAVRLASAHTLAISLRRGERILAYTLAVLLLAANWAYVLIYVG